MDLFFFGNISLILLFISVAGWATLYSALSRIFVALVDIDRNMKFLMKGRTEPFPHKIVWPLVSIASASFALLLYSLSFSTVGCFACALMTTVISSIYLIKIAGTWWRKYTETVSDFIAEIRYNGDDNSKENNRWRVEQEQWLLLVDLLGDRISRKSELLVDESICGKSQPLTPNNRRKLEWMGFQISELGASQIKLDNSNNLCCPL